MAYRAYKIKVEVSSEDVEKCKRIKEEMAWIWNTVRAIALKLHSETWYKWAEKKKTQSIFGEFNFDGVVKVPIFIGDNAFIGATCRIATGGPYWKKDEKVTIQTRKGLKHGYRLMDGDRPYTPVPIEEWVYPTLGGVEIRRIGDCDRKALLNAERASQGLGEITSHSDIFGELIRNRFATTWKEFLDVTKPNRKKPRYRDGAMESIGNTQNPPTQKNGQFLVKGDKKPIVLIPKEKRQLQGEPKTYTLIEKPSGTYLCAVCEVDIQHKPGKTDRIVGIDPGLAHLITTDHGTHYAPSEAPEKYEKKIVKYQKELARLQKINDVRLGRTARDRYKRMTENEKKIAAKISRAHEQRANATKAKVAKLSTRIANIYGSGIVLYEKNDYLRMQGRPNAIVTEDGYGHNQAEQQSALNRKFANASLGALHMLIKRKVEERGGVFIEVNAAYKTQTCHCCGQKLKNPIKSQQPFICQNEKCELFGVEQNQDVNAALNVRAEGLKIYHERLEKEKEKKEG